MSMFIQELESRQMFSASPAHVVVGAAAAVPHVSVPVNRTMYFQGTSMNSDGSVDADVLVTVKPAGKGYTATILVFNPHGKMTTVNLKVNAAGQFNYFDSENGDSTTVTGQLSADKQSITGTTVQVTPNGANTTTIDCTPTSTAPTVADFAGKMISGKKSAGLKATLAKTSSGYLGVLTMVPVDPGSNNGGLFFTVGPTGSFTASMNEGSQTLTVTGQLSRNGKTLSGTFTGLVVDGTAINGTFSLKRS